MEGMENEFSVCQEHWIEQTARLSRVQMMNRLGIGTEEMSDIIIGGGFRQTAVRAFNYLWDSMTAEEKIDYFYSIRNGDEDEE